MKMYIHECFHNATTHFSHVKILCYGTCCTGQCVLTIKYIVYYIPNAGSISLLNTAVRGKYSNFSNYSLLESVVYG